MSPSKHVSKIHLSSARTFAVVAAVVVVSSPCSPPARRPPSPCQTKARWSLFRRRNWASTRSSTRLPRAHSVKSRVRPMLLLSRRRAALLTIRHACSGIPHYHRPEGCDEVPVESCDHRVAYEDACPARGRLHAHASPSAHHQTVGPMARLLLNLAHTTILVMK